ncbi:MAG: ribosome maturation factor RimM [Spirochaetia bacterium]|nr:ribosome maturation factor RimM [Spirochaetia bacterium]
MSANPEERTLAIARLGSPRGLRGYLKVHSFSGEYGHILKLKEAVLYPPQSAVQQSSAPRKLKVKGFEEGEWGISIAFAGYESPEKARELVGMAIVVPREQACPLRDNEWYIGDLVGMDLVFQGSVKATVAGVLDGGPDPLLEARLLEDGRTVLVPFRNEFIGKVDTSAGSMELLVDWILS